MRSLHEVYVRVPIFFICIVTYIYDTHYVRTLSIGFHGCCAATAVVISFLCDEFLTYFCCCSLNNVLDSVALHFDQMLEILSPYAKKKIQLVLPFP